MYRVILVCRYMFRRRITLVAVLAVAVCVFMAEVVMTVMSGLAGDFKDKNHRWVGDCVISTESLVGFGGYEELLDIFEKAPFVEAASAVVNGYALLTYEDTSYTEAVELVGIDPARHCAVTSFGKSLYYHADDCRHAFEPLYDSDLPGCVPGIDKVMIRDGDGRYHHLINPPRYRLTVNCFPLTEAGTLARAGLDIVSTKTFYFSDYCHSGLAKVDGAVVYIDLKQAQDLLGMAGPDKRASAVHVRFKNGVSLQEGYLQLRLLWRDFVASRTGGPDAKLLDQVRLETWKQYSRDVIAAVEKEQAMMVACFVMVGVITVFIVFAVFYMIAGGKRRDVGILASAGACPRKIVEMFLGFAFLVGLAGSAAGTAGAMAFLAGINDIEGWLYRRFGFQLWNRAIYAIDDIPNNMGITTAAFIVAAAVAACLLGAAVPSRRAGRLDPAEAIGLGGL